MLKILSQLRVVRVALLHLFIYLGEILFLTTDVHQGFNRNFILMVAFILKMLHVKLTVSFK